MTLRNWTGIIIGVAVLALGVFIAANELRTHKWPRLWLPVAALAPGVLILVVAWSTSQMRQRNREPADS